MTRFIRCAAILGGLFVASSSALAQSNGPDVIVGDIPDTCHFNFTAINGKHAYAIGTNACNVGDVPLLWHSNDNQHPVIGSNLFRLMNGRFEQIGQGWPKHGFGADNAHLCGTCPVPTDGNSLGPACSDWYDCNTNGNQQFLGPKSEINSATGGMPWPHGNGSGSGPLFKRLQANQSDLALPGALYFVEAQYIQFQDAGFGNGNNNNSYRRVTVTAPGYNLLVADATRVRRAAIQAWPDNGRGPNTPDPSVRLENVDIPGDGRVIVASKVTELGNGQWHYEYAIQNVNSDRSIGSVSVPAVGSLTLSNIEFHDVDYHSGEAYDNTDWTMARGATGVSWSSPQTFAQNPNSNALRWGTLYNYRFDTNAPPAQALGVMTLGVFKPGTPTTVAASVVVPDIHPYCACDLDRTGDISSNDFFAFIAGFFALQADFNGDGVVNTEDFFEFLTCFFNACQ